MYVHVRYVYTYKESIILLNRRIIKIISIFSLMFYDIFIKIKLRTKNNYEK